MTLPAYGILNWQVNKHATIKDGCAMHTTKFSIVSKYCERVHILLSQQPKLLEIAATQPAYVVGSLGTAGKVTILSSCILECQEVRCK